MIKPLVKSIREELINLNVVDSTVFLPNEEDEIAAAAVELLMLNEEPGEPTFEAVDIWLNLSKGISSNADDVQRCLDIYRRYYVDEGFRKNVLAPLGKISQDILREQDLALVRFKTEHGA